MLANNYGRSDFDEHLTQAPCDIELPYDEDEFFAKSGPMPAVFDDRRQFPRFYYRHQAILKTLSTLPAFPRTSRVKSVYTRDISKHGVGFLFDEQLYPKEVCQLILPDVCTRNIEVTSCRRVRGNCFEIGAQFTVAP